MINITQKFYRLLDTLIFFYSILIVLRIFMSWLPSINWDEQPAKFIRILTDSYLEIFRKIVPAIGGLDFSPIVALFILGIIQNIIKHFAMIA